MNAARPPRVSVACVDNGGVPEFLHLGLPRIRARGFLITFRVGGLGARPSLLHHPN